MKDLHDTQTLDFVSGHNDTIHTLFQLFMKLKDSKIAHSELCILSVIANDMTLNARLYCDKSQREIASELKLKETNVSRSIKKLKDKSYIEVKDKKIYFTLSRELRPK